MCGIVGFIDYFNPNKETSEAILIDMCRLLAHRGPNDTGLKLLTARRAMIGLGHSRLSIIDLSAKGHQPMSFDGLTITYNGEIYNYREIKKQLEAFGHIFFSDSDTEVVLKAFYQWGIAATERFIGMFAFAIFDTNNAKLTLVRDRAGVKPLYYYVHQGLFLFASELKSFHQHPVFKRDISIDLDALSLYVQFGYVPSPYAIFKNTFKLPAGSYLELSLEKPPIEATVSTYWSPFMSVNKPRLKLTSQEAEHEVEKLLVSASNYRMISDVPVGIFLSGGYDSSLIAALLQKEQTQKIKTFTVGFNSENHNEALHAKSIADYIGTDHHEIYCSDRDFSDIFLKLPYIFDEPLADESAIPTFLLCEFAKSQVTVALSGDGGDELFFGYQKYCTIISEYKKLKRIPVDIGIVAVNLITALASFFNSSIASKHKKVGYFLEQEKRYPTIQNLLHTKNTKLTPRQVAQFLVHGEGYYLLKHEFVEDNTDLMAELLATDYRSNMSDAIVVKVERASMACSLEAREPLLDHRLYDFVAQLPGEIRNPTGGLKTMLKSIAHKYIPKELLDRPKQGFAPPLEHWVSMPLFQEVVEQLISKTYLKKQNLFYDDLRQKILFTSKATQTRMLYNLVVFQLWYERWCK